MQVREDHRRCAAGGAARTLLGGLLLVACAPDHGEQPAVGIPLVQRVELVGAALESGERLLGEYTPDERWTTTAGTSEIGPAKAHGEGPFLRLQGTAPLAVRIPIEPAVARFNRVEVDLLARPARAVVLVGGLADEKLIFTAAEPAQGRRRIQTLAFSVPYWARSLAEPDAIEIRFEGTPRALVARVRLFEEAWGGRLPSPAPAPVSIHGRTMPARGLSTDVPLAAEVEVPVDGRLAIAAGIPPDLRWPDRAVELVVRIGRESSAREHRFSLPIEHTAGWIEHTLALGEHSGGRVPLSFELAAEDGWPAYAALATPLVSGRRNDPQTIVLITSDTHRYDHVAAARVSVTENDEGEDEHAAETLALRTPALDELGRAGVFYENCLTATNVTIPSHASLLTGVHVRDTRLVNNFTMLVDAAPTLAERFRDEGFVTLAVVSSAHLDHRRSGLGQGFDRMDSPSLDEFRAEETVERVRARLAAVEGLPVFLWIHLFDAHTPYDPPAGFAGLYYPADRDPYDESLAPPLPGQAVAADPGVRDLDYARALYGAEVTYMDRALGELLREDRLTRGTVLFTADHGESLGEHEIYWDHAGLYPVSIHVPLILRGRGVPVGGRVSAPVRQIDAGRTLLDLAGLEHVEFPGRSLLADVDGDASAPPVRRPRFAIAAHALDASISSGPWLLILTLRDYRVNPRFVRLQHSVELFDLVADPGCTHDLVPREPETAARLRDELIGWLADARGTGWGQAVVDDAETLKRMAELGYTDLADEPGDAADDEPAAWIDPDCRCPACAAWD